MNAEEMHTGRTRIFFITPFFAIASLIALAWPGAPALRAQQPAQNTGTDGGQTAAGQTSDQDTGQPARAVRLSYVDGTVHLAMGNRQITDKAVANSPLLQGMTLSTADDGRAEIQFEDGSVARLSPDTSLTLTALTGQGATGDAELTVNRGLAYFELEGNGQAGQIGIHFGDMTVTGSGFTVLRIRDDTPPGNLAVFSGNAHVDRGTGVSLDLHGGESVSFSASDAGSYDLAESIEPDSWDAWNSDRDQELTQEATAQSPAANSLAGGEASNPAWSDLNANGSWYNVPDQGYVWSPYDASNPGFDPYGNGSWVMTPGFGYTWASAYPWGYLPYQCGMWNFYDGFGWGWAPGMGGCTPWWNIGFYGGPFIGFAPGWYRPVHRPIIPRPGRPVGIIPVTRHPQVMSAGLPARDGSRPVEIAGARVSPIRSLPVRAAYDRAELNGGSRSYAGDGRPGYVATRPGYTPGARPTSGALGRTYAPATHYSAPPRAYSAPSHVSSGGGYHGGGGGGGGNASHGGGGGGGGASHGGGGGGGGGRK